MSLSERNGLPCLKWCPPEDAAAQDLGGEHCIIYEEKSRYQNRLEGQHMQSHNLLEVCLSERGFFYMENVDLDVIEQH